MKNSRKNKVGVITQEQTSPEAILRLARESVFPFQRNHTANSGKKSYLKGTVALASQIFVAVYVLALKKLYFIDGYHRAEALREGRAIFDPKFPLYLQTHTVETMEDAERLYSQHNSLEAAKKSNDYFDSALRKCNKLNAVVSGLMGAQGRVTAVQLASGLTGSANTTKAAIAVMDGFMLVDSFRLRKNGEIGGLKGVYVAVAQHCENKRLVEYFVRSVNSSSFCPMNPTTADKQIQRFKDWLATPSGRTGGGVNKTVFEAGLAAFMSFAMACQRGRGRPRNFGDVEGSMTLGQFREAVQLIKPM